MEPLLGLGALWVTAAGVGPWVPILVGLHHFVPSFMADPSIVCECLILGLGLRTELWKGSSSWVLEGMATPEREIVRRSILRTCAMWCLWGFLEQE